MSTLTLLCHIFISLCRIEWITGNFMSGRSTKFKLPWPGPLSLFLHGCRRSLILLWQQPLAGYVISPPVDLLICTCPWPGIDSLILESSRLSVRGTLLARRRLLKELVYFLLRQFRGYSWIIKLDFSYLVPLPRTQVKLCFPFSSAPGNTCCGCVYSIKYINGL